MMDVSASAFLARAGGAAKRASVLSASLVTYQLGKLIDTLGQKELTRPSVGTRFQLDPVTHDERAPPP